MKRIIQQVKQLLTRKTCAIMPINEQDFALVALQQLGKYIEVDAIVCGSLLELSKNFKNYGLCLAIAQADVVVKNWFFPAKLKPYEIYQELSRQEMAIDQAYVAFDIEINPSSIYDQLVVGYFLKQKTYQRLVDQYGCFGWQIVAIEPDHLLRQKQLNKSWQLNAIKKYQSLWQQYPCVEKVELCLKLLDRDNHYG